jgi:Nucleotidyltransferase domain.
MHNEAVIALEHSEMFQSILREIRRVSTPVKVVLFGSRARGDFDAESDYDVLVVLSDEAELKIEREKLESAVAKLPASVQLLVKRWSEYEAMSGVTVGLWRNIREEGVVLYEQELPNAIKPLEMKTNQDIAKHCWKKPK